MMQQVQLERDIGGEDEIGTPFCICVDFDTESDGCVTIRDRDSMEQVRIPVAEVKSYIEERLMF